MSNENLSYCGNVVRKYDPDRFLISLFAPAERREALWALFAFNYEVSKTRAVVSDAALGRIRVQWWREEVEKIFGIEGNYSSIPDHEVLGPLAEAIRDYNLSFDLFDDLFTAWSFDLEDGQPETLNALLFYSGRMEEPLLSLALRIMGGEEALEPVSPIAVNYALAVILRRVPLDARQERCLLPEDLMNLHGVSLGALYCLEPEDGFDELVGCVVDEFVTDICTHNALLNAVQHLSMIYAAQIRRRRFKLFSPKMATPPAFKELRLALRGLPFIMKERIRKNAA